MALEKLIHCKNAFTYQIWHEQKDILFFNCISHFSVIFFLSMLMFSVRMLLFRDCNWKSEMIHGAQVLYTA